MAMTMSPINHTLTPSMLALAVVLALPLIPWLP